MSGVTSAANSKSVAQGGAMFSTSRVTVSKETQEMLKVMMNESKLTSFQQRQLRETMRAGGTLPLVCNPTTSSPGGGDLSKKTPSKRQKRLSKQGVRTKETIEGMVDNEPDYKPAPARYNSSKEKQRLQNVMAFGSDLKPVKPVPAHPLGESKPEIDRFDEILQEIAERKDFLDEMDSLGQGDKHRNIIMTEISQRIRELEVLDKQRCKEVTEHVLGTK